MAAVYTAVGIGAGILAAMEARRFTKKAHVSWVGGDVEKQVLRASADPGNLKVLQRSVGLSHSDFVDPDNRKDYLNGTIGGGDGDIGDWEKHAKEMVRLAEWRAGVCRWEWDPTAGRPKWSLSDGPTLRGSAAAWAAVCGLSLGLIGGVHGVSKVGIGAALAVLCLMVPAASDRSCRNTPLLWFYCGMAAWVSWAVVLFDWQTVQSAVISGLAVTAVLEIVSFVSRSTGGPEILALPDSVVIGFLVAVGYILSGDALGAVIVGFGSLAAAWAHPFVDKLTKRRGASGTVCLLAYVPTGLALCSCLI